MTETSPPTPPVPQGNYVAARRFGNFVYTSGMTPRRAGELLYAGPIRPDDELASHREAVRLAAGNALAAARALAESGEAITDVLNLTVFIAAAPGFVAHSKLADYASDYFREELGPGGIGSRAAVGVATLPGGAPVEIQLVAVASRR